MRRLPPLVLVLMMTSARLSADEAPRPVSFKEQVAPILVKSCLGCHNAQKAAGGLNMSTFALLKQGGKTAGDLILEPGDPESSHLIELVRPGGAPRMPYKQPPLTAVAVQTLEAWISQGAKFDGPSETETPLASLVDPLRDLPKVALKVPAVAAATALAFAPDGKTLAAALGRKVVLFDAGTGKPVATFDDHPGPLTSVRFTPDGKTLVASGGRPGMWGSVTVWDLATKGRRREWKGHRDAILAAELAPDGKTLATASYDREVMLWELAAGTRIRTLKDHTDAVYAVAFAPDGQTLASAGADRTVKLWDVASGRKLHTLADSTAELYAVVFGPDGKTVLAGGVDRSIRSWAVSEPDAPLVRSVFAHDAPILRLVVTPDGKALVSSGEDDDVKVWDRATLQARSALTEQPDWPQGLAVSPDSARLAVGRHDGSIGLYDLATGKPALTVNAVPAPPPAAKPELSRNATLNPIAPRGGMRGSKPKLVLSGTGVGRAAAVIFNEPGLSATIVPRPKPDPNALDVELTIAPDARVGLHRIGVVTPLGVPPFQPFAVTDRPEAAEVEPNDDPGPVPPVILPAVLVGTIERPGDRDCFRFEARAGQQFVFAMTAKALGSGLIGVMIVLDESGTTIAEAGTDDGATDPVLTVTMPHDGVYVLRVADADYGGSGNHFYRIAAGADPYLTAVWPLGVERGPAATIQVAGLNLGPVATVALPVPTTTAPGALLDVPVTPRPVNRRSVVVADGPQRVEQEGNDDPAHAEPVRTPGGVSGRIDRPGDSDCFRFDARKGQRLIVEVFGRRLGTPIDPVLEILNAEGHPVPRAVLRPVAETNVAFRDHNATSPGVRLTQWTNLAMNDDVLIGRELTRIRALPRNPDDDCQLWSEQGRRVGLLETTPEHHPIGQTISKVEIHPPGAVFPPGGVPPVTLSYRNDDGGAGLGKDARITFDPPADGPYVVRVEDVRGLGGAAYGYHLVVRAPRPDFKVALSTDNPNVPRGGTALLTATATRIDGFDGPIDVAIAGLPRGVTATAAQIEKGEESANFVLMAAADAPAFSPPSWTATARPAVDSPAAALRHDLDPGGPSGGWITVTPAPNLKVAAVPGRVVIAPGQRVAVTLAVERGPAFAGRVPIEVRNLPQGVRVLNVGLNGVLVTEKQSERAVFLYAEPWVGPLDRPFYAVGRAESAGTDHSSPPIELVVRRP